MSLKLLKCTYSKNRKFIPVSFKFEIKYDTMCENSNIKTFIDTPNKNEKVP